MKPKIKPTIKRIGKTNQPKNIINPTKMIRISAKIPIIIRKNLKTAPKILEIRLEKMSVSFDPRNIMPIEGYGTVYPTLRVSDNWGILTVSNGALLGTNWDKITVSEPTLINKNKVVGNGWTIDLNKGYIIEKNSSDKNYSLKKQ